MFPDDADAAGPWTTLPEQLKNEKEKKRKKVDYIENVVNTSKLRARS